MYVDKLARLFKRNYAQAGESRNLSNFKRAVSTNAGIHPELTGMPSVKKDTKRFTNLLNRLKSRP